MSQPSSSTAGNSKLSAPPPELSAKVRLSTILSEAYQQNNMLRNGIDYAHGCQPEPASERISDPSTYTEYLDHIEAALRVNREKLEFLLARL